MLSYILQGITYGFAAAVQPGPLQAYIILQALKNGWRRSLVYAFVPLLSDLPIIVLVVGVLAAIPHAWVTALQLVGGAFLLYLAWKAFRAARHLAQNPVGEGAPSRGLFQAVLINLLNPNPYLFWGLITGPILLTGWKESPANGIAMLAAFYLVMILFNALIILVVSIAHRFNPRLRQWLMIASAIGLAAFGVYQVWMGVTGRT
ncbi:MAG: LysE family translocator [Anaerolineales bacterium]|nr:LysE family translocator [Anaerolineales bacterium]